MQQTVKQEKQLKVRDVKEFLKEHVVDEAVEHSALATVRQRRAYRVESVAKNDNTLYDATMYFNTETQQLELLTQKIANQLVDDYIQTVELFAKFTAQDIMTLHRTCGGAYGDKVRKQLYSRSFSTTVDEIMRDINAVITNAIAKNKSLLKYDVLEEQSLRKRYEFIRIQ